MFFKLKKRHDKEVKRLQISIKDNFDKAAAEPRRNRQALEKNGITLEIKKALGGSHG